VITHIFPNGRHDPNFLLVRQDSDLLSGHRSILR